MSELMYIYAHVDVLLLIMARVLAFVWVLPIKEETKLPRMAVAGFSLCIAFSVYFQVDVNATYYTQTLLSFTLAIIKEIIVGLIIGFVVKIYFQVFAFVGTLLSMQGGLSMSMVMDPSSGIQSTTIGRIYTLGFTALFMVSNGYHWLIHTFIDAFDIIPINGAVFRTDIVGTVIEMIAGYLEIGLKLSLPIVAIIIIIDFAMGIMAKSVPQINMFVVGIPLKMIIMFLLMVMTVQMIHEYSFVIVEALTNTINEIIQGMRGL